MWLFTPSQITAYKVDAPQILNPLESLSEKPTKDELKLAINFLSDKYGWRTVAYSVLIAESGGNPEAENPEWHYIKGKPFCKGSLGLFQLSCLHGKTEDLLNPRKNIELAFKLWKESGWRIWGVCTNGTVKCF